MGNFKEGDRVRALDSALRGRVLKILDVGYLMILEEDHEMEINLHQSELVLEEQPHSTAVPFMKEEDNKSKTPDILRIDLHLSGQESESSLHPIEKQLKKLKAGLDQAHTHGTRRVEVIHGKGKGRLHQACLQVLRSHSRVLDFKILKVALEPPHGILVNLR